METRFQVVFSGNLRPGVTPAQAEAAVAATFGVPTAQAAELVRVTALTVLKRGLDQAGAVRYLQALASAGLVATAQPMPDPATPRADDPAAQRALAADPPRRPSPAQPGRAAPPAPPTPQSQTPAPRRSTRYGQSGRLAQQPPSGEPDRPVQPAPLAPGARLELVPKSGGRCPSCGASAVVDGACGACGIIVEKYLAAEAQRRARDRGFAPTPVRGWEESEPDAPFSPRSPSRAGGVGRGRESSVVGGVVLIFLMLFGVMGALMGPDGASDHDPTALPAPPAYVRPTTAPNGQPWPTVADYVNGYQQLNTGGYSNVHIDNSRGQADVFVKLFTLDGPQPRAARVMFIPAHRQMTVNNVGAGHYDIRFRSLDDGQLLRSEPFELTETHSGAGVQYSEFTLTLYTVAGGNARSYPLSESEF